MSFDAELSAILRRNGIRERVSPFIEKRLKSQSALEKQFISTRDELIENPLFLADPLNEDDSDIHPFADVIHKYPNKILYLTTDECPVYCRYCTRKRKTLKTEGHLATPLQTICAYISKRPEIHEVIFSGGDPLMLSNEKLEMAMRQFLSLNQIKFIRIHSRVPTTLPNRVSQKSVKMFSQFITEFNKVQFVFVIHINHPSELSDEGIQALRRLESAGFRILSQSVLLHEINDNPIILSELFSQLYRLNIQPYYLHQLDRVEGSAHFEVDITRGREIMRELKMLIPPYMIPRYVMDSKQGKSRID